MVDIELGPHLRHIPIVSDEQSQFELLNCRACVCVCVCVCQATEGYSYFYQLSLLPQCTVAGSPSATRQMTVSEHLLVGLWQFALTSDSYSLS